MGSEIIMDECARYFDARLQAALQKFKLRMQWQIDGTVKPFDVDDFHSDGGNIKIDFDETLEFPRIAYVPRMKDYSPASPGAGDPPQQASDPHEDSGMSTLNFPIVRQCCPPGPIIASKSLEDSASDVSPATDGLAGINLVRFGNDVDVDARAGTIDAFDGPFDFSVRPKLVLLTPRDWTKLERFDIQFLVDFDFFSTFSPDPAGNPGGLDAWSLRQWYFQQYGPPGLPFGYEYDSGDVTNGGPKLTDPILNINPLDLAALLGEFPVIRDTKSATRLPPHLTLTVTGE